jgi:hypothetical protein
VTIGHLAALVCIILGFVSAFAEEKLLLSVTDWFIAAIAFCLLGGPVLVAWHRREG